MPRKNSTKKLLTCGASYKPPALPGDTYLRKPMPPSQDIRLERCCAFLDQRAHCGDLNEDLKSRSILDMRSSAKRIRPMVGKPVILSGGLNLLPPHTPVL